MLGGDFPEQLFFNLQPQDRYALSYLVRHSGIAEAVAALEGGIGRLTSDPSRSELFLIVGPKGSGKTHLVSGYAAAVCEQGLRVFTCEFSEALTDEGEIGLLVSAYERVRAEGGMLIFSAPVGALEISSNPHLKSRLLACQILTLNYPREEELRTIILSLLERHNLKLSEHSLEYLLRRLPRDPLSFDSIFARINASSLRQARPAGQTVVREALSKSKI